MNSDDPKWQELSALISQELSEHIHQILGRDFEGLTQWQAICLVARAVQDTAAEFCARTAYCLVEEKQQGFLKNQQESYENAAKLFLRALENRHYD